ncbi:hypothetical protein [Photobacterium proteolyticum]|uniref:hypothetical protein n=1 Tax=Photobacterium proteolyticum TaxID=1903952 RepID=UPI000ADC3E85|nr:hypothetical protein [Photobacterium proteolyticum]
MLSVPIPIPDTSPCVTSAETPLSLEYVLQDFISVKSAEVHRPLTVKQLWQRIGHFVAQCSSKLSICFMSKEGKRMRMLNTLVLCDLIEAMEEAESSNEYDFGRFVFDCVSMAYIRLLCIYSPNRTT